MDKVQTTQHLPLTNSNIKEIPASVEKWRRELHRFRTGEELLAFRTYGDLSNPAVVLLHGLPTSSYLYRDIAPHIAERGYFVVVPDFVGFGASSKPTDDSAYDMQLQASRLTQLLSSLKIEEYHLVAHDMGGLVGFELLVQQLEKAKSFFVLNTTAYTDGFTPPNEMKMLAGSMGSFLTFMMSNRVTGKFLTAKFIGDNMGNPDRLTQEAKENYFWPMHEGATRPMRAIAKSFDKIMARYPIYQSAMKAYKGPSRLLWGAKDKVLNFEKLSAQFARDLRMAPSSIGKIENAGHFLQEDYPEKVTEQILMLLSQAK